MPLPGYVRDAIQRLFDAGHIAYVVGGSVRDFLVGRETKDHDLATDANPDELCALFPEAVTVGKAFGVLKVPVRATEGEKAPEFFEVATFREDLEYEDHRHPVAVRFSGPEEDARRRDFTINALFYDAKTQRILDPTGGMTDLERRVIRAIGDPDQRFKEDALRLLRAVRFTTALGFELEAQTAEALKARARLIRHVSSERIRDELTLILKGPRAAEALELLRRLHLLEHVLPEVHATVGLPQPGAPPSAGKDDVWLHTLRALRWLERHDPTRSATLAWATLLHETGKPAAWQRNKKKNYNGHETDGARIAAVVANRLKMSRQDCDSIAAMVADHLKFKEVFEMRESTLVRFVRQPHFAELLELHRADALATDGNLAFHDFCRSRLDAFQKGEGRDLPRLIDGTDLIQLGFKPGPEFSEILRIVEDLAIERRLVSKDQALEFVVQNFVR